MGGLWIYLMGSVGLSGFGLCFIVEDVIVGIDFSFKIIIISGDFFMFRCVVCLQVCLCMLRRVVYFF